MIERDNFPPRGLIRAALRTLCEQNEKVTAVMLCDLLVARGYERRIVQLSIQRSMERQEIIVDRDWNLSEGK